MHRRTGPKKPERRHGPGSAAHHAARHSAPKTRVHALMALRSIRGTLPSLQGTGDDRCPKIAEPTRTWVAPNWIAVTKSALMPIDRCFRPLRAAIFAVSAKCGAGASV